MCKDLTHLTYIFLCVLLRAAVVNQITDLTLRAVKLFQLDACVRVCVCWLVYFFAGEVVDREECQHWVFKWMAKCKWKQVGLDGAREKLEGGGE